MSIFGDVYRAVFYQPVFNALVWLYNVIPGHDLGLAIIALTALVRLVLWPLTAKAMKSQRAMQALQPRLKALQEEHKGDKEKLARATMALYGEAKVNPASSCLPMLVQLPFLIAIYQALQNGINQKLDLLYPFVKNPGAIAGVSFGALELANPSLPLALLAGISQYLLARSQRKLSPPAPSAEPGKPDMMSMMNKQMLYVMPAMTVFIGIKLPAGLALYWLVTNLLTLFQQWHFMRDRQTKTS